MADPGNPFAAVSEGFNQGTQIGGNAGADFARLSMQIGMQEKELAFKKEQQEANVMEHKFQKGKWVFDKIGDLAKLPAGPLKNEMLKGFGTQMNQLGYQDTSIVQAMMKDPEWVKKMNEAMVKFPLLNKDEQAQVIINLAETVGTDAFPKQLDNFLNYNIDLAKREKEAAIELNKEKEKEKLKPSPAAESALRVTGETVGRQSGAVNQVYSRMLELGEANGDIDQQVKIAQSMFKILNSMDGMDAVQNEEAKRIGSFLEKVSADWKGASPVRIGRDVEAFRKQVVNWLRGSVSTLKLNNEQIANIGGKGKLNLKIPEISDNLGLYTKKQMAEREKEAVDTAGGAPAAKDAETISLLQNAKNAGATKEQIISKFPNIPKTIIDRVYK